MSHFVNKQLALSTSLAFGLLSGLPTEARASESGEPYGGSVACSDAAVRAQAIRYLTADKAPAGGTTYSAATTPENASTLKLAFDESPTGFTLPSNKPSSIVSLPGGSDKAVTLGFARGKPGVTIDVRLCEYRRSESKTWSTFKDSDLKLATSKGFRLSASASGASAGIKVAFEDLDLKGYSDSRVIVAIVSPKGGSDATVSVTLGLKTSSDYANTSSTAGTTKTDTSNPSWASITDWGVDRGDSYSTVATKWMKAINSEYGSPSINKSTAHCLSAVKRALMEADNVPDGDATVAAYKFQESMRKASGYKELVANWDPRDLPKLKDKLPVGTVIIYRAFDEDAGFSVKYGHIDTVARYNGVKSLMSDYINKYDNGWGWLGTKQRNMQMWIFVPTSK